MVKKSKGASRVSLWMNGEHVGHWQNAAADRQSLEYSDHWLRSPNARPISLSLPLSPSGTKVHGLRVRAWFDNLLPDSPEIRRRIAARYGLDSTAAFALLGEIGRDCVGALQLLPDGESPGDIKRITGQPLDEQDIEQLLFDVVRAPSQALGAEDEFRISIAGAQEKTALLRHQGRWFRPVGSTPTTHILKLPLGRVANLDLDLGTSVENEWLCLRLLEKFGLRTASCEVATFGTKKVLLVARFDRRLHPDGSWIVRIPQEDFCQATGIPPNLKYEADGGPGMRSVLGILAHSRERERDRRDFFKAQVLFHLMAATDGHGKNFSLTMGRGGAFQMSPLYDVVSVWPICGDGPGRLPYRKLKLAMAVRTRNPHYRLHEIHRRHWLEAARALQLGSQAALWLDQVLDDVPSALDRMAAELPAGFPEPIFSAIRDGMLHTRDRIAASE